MFPRAWDVLCCSTIAGTVISLSDKILTTEVTVVSILNLNTCETFVDTAEHALRHIMQTFYYDVARKTTSALIHSRIDYANSISRY